MKNKNLTADTDLYRLTPLINDPVTGGVVDFLLLDPMTEGVDHKRTLY